MSLDLGELVGRLRLDSDQYDKGLDKAEKGFKGLGNRITALATSIGIGAAVAFGTSLVGAMDQQDVGVKVAAQMGRTVEDAERFGKIAGQVYASNWGQSVGDVGDVLSKVIRSGADLGLEGLDDEFEQITTKAIVLRDVFNQDVAKSINAATQIMRNGLAPNADRAFDIIARGVQLGVDKSEDLLDTFNEYSTQFRELGITAEEALGLMSQGLKAGARDADTVADALKEFAIRSKDASKLSAEGFQAIGLDAAKMTKIFAAGGKGAADGLDLVLDRLRAMKDPVTQDAAAVALFGTKAEDLADSLFALDLSSATESIGEVAGATDKAAAMMGTSASANIATFKKQLELAFINTLGGLVLPKITEAAAFLANNFGPAFKATAGWIKENQEWLAPLAVTLGTFIGIITVITAAMKVWAIVSAAYTTVQWALNTALSANPIGLIIIAIAALVAGIIYAYKNSETFRKIVDAAFRGIAVVAMWLWRNVLSPLVKAVVGYYKMWAAIAIWLWRNVLSPAFKVIAALFARFMQNLRSAAALFTWLGRTVIGPIINLVVGYIKFWAGIWAWLWTNGIKPAIDKIAAAVAWVADKIGAGFSIVIGWARKLRDAWFNIFDRVAGFVSNAFGTAVDFVKRHINTLIGLVNKAIGFINRHVVGGLNKVPGVDFTTIPTLPKLAQGGTVFPRVGGRAVVMGDGNEVEYGVPHSDMERIIDRAVRAGGGGASVIEIVVMDEMRRVRKKTRVQAGTGRVGPVIVGA